MENANQELKNRLLQLEVWARLSLVGSTPQHMVQKLQAGISITAQ